MASKPSPEKQIEALREEIRHHEHLYYVLDAPEITDAEYDARMNRLKALEAEHPELITPDSPTQRVGGKPREGFVKTPHSRPMLSLDNAYNEAELRAWDQRVRDALPSTDQVRYVCELKLDGLSLALHYAPGAGRLGATPARPDPRRRHDRRRCHLQRAHHPLGAAARVRREVEGGAACPQTSRCAARSCCRKPRS